MEHTTNKQQILVAKESQYQYIEIRSHSQYGQQLWLNHDLQISTCDTAYNTAMISPLFGKPNCNKILIMGGGDGGVLNELLRSKQPQYFLPTEVTMVDIDAKVIELCQTYLECFWQQLKENPQSAQVIIDDAFKYLAQANTFDAIIYDLTMDPIRKQQSRITFIRETLLLIAQHLRPGGILSMQCCGLEEPDPAIVLDNKQLKKDVLEQLQAIKFTNITVQQVWVPSFEGCWTFVTAQKL